MAAFVLAIIVGVLISGYAVAAIWGLSRYNVHFVKKPPKAPPAPDPDPDPTPVKPGSGTGVSPDADPEPTILDHVKTFLIRGLAIVGIMAFGVIVFLLVFGDQLSGLFS